MVQKSLVSTLLFVPGPQVSRLLLLVQLSVVVAFLVEVGNVVLLVVLLAVGLVAELLFVLEAVVEFVVLEILMLCTSAEPL